MFLYVIPKVLSYYLQEEPYFYDQKINITGNKHTKKQDLTNNLIGVFIIVLLVFILIISLESDFLNNYIFQPISLLLYIEVLYSYGKYIYELVFRKKENIMTSKFKNRRNLLGFKIYFLLVVSILSSSELLNFITNLITNQIVLESLIILFQLIYTSIVIISILDSVSYIIKDTLILFNKKELKRINIKGFLLEKLISLENTNDGRWNVLVNSKKIMQTINQFIIYFLIRSYSLIYYGIIPIVALFDRTINFIINFLNKFINKNLYIFPRIIFVGILIYYYIILNLDSNITVETLNIYEFISTLFVIPLLLDELSNYSGKVD